MHARMESARRQLGAVTLVGGALLVTACADRPPTQAPTVLNGVQRYAQSGVSGKIACGPMPIALGGNRTEIELTGACEKVTIEGAHNDIVVDIVPGGTIEITGTHNDVVWRQIREGERPILQDLGASNAFHRG